MMEMMKKKRMIFTEELCVELRMMMMLNECSREKEERKEAGEEDGVFKDSNLNFVDLYFSRKSGATSTLLKLVVEFLEPCLCFL
jgi:hypothetical protein